MRNSYNLYLVIGAIAVARLAGAAPVDNTDRDVGIYLTVDGGVNFLQDAASKNGFGFGPTGTTVTSDSGERIDLLAGYRFNQSWEVELEGGYAENHVTSIGGVKPLTDINFRQYPLLANVVFRQPFGNHWRASLGAGLGGSWTTLDINPLGNDTDFQFAYQAKAGISYDLGKGLEFGILYQFLGTGDHQWTVAGIPGGTDSLMSHSIMATLTLKF